MQTNNEELNKSVRSDIYKIDPKSIVVIDGFNSRTDFGDLDELAEQIRQQGMLNPITVVPFKDENGEEKYRLIDGERRYRAVMKLIKDGMDIKRISALYQSRAISEEEMLIQQVMRNEGKPFTPYELGIWATKMMDKFGYTLAEIAAKIGKNQGSLCRFIGYQNLPEYAREMLAKDEISASNLDRVMNAHGEDENGAIEELKDLKEKSKGKKHVSLRNLESTSKTVDYKRSKDVLKGLEALFTSIAEYQQNNEGKVINEINLNLYYEELKAGKMLKQIFDNVAKTTDEEELEEFMERI